MVLAASTVSTHVSFADTVLRGDWLVSSVVLTAIAAGTAARARPSSEARAAVCHLVAGLGVFAVAIGSSWFVAILSEGTSHTTIYVYTALFWSSGVAFSGVAAYMTHVEDVVRSPYVNP